MKLEVCDICGKVLHPHSKRDLRGAVSILLGAESVCEECAEKAQKMDARESNNKIIFKSVKNFKDYKG